MGALCRGLILGRGAKAQLSSSRILDVSASPHFSLHNLHNRSVLVHSCCQPSHFKNQHFLFLDLPLTSSLSSFLSPPVKTQMENSARISTVASFGDNNNNNNNNNGRDSAVFPLSSSTVLKINKGDITKWLVDGSSDAIVNPANAKMLGGGGADGAIHRAAGPELLDACYEVPEVLPGIRCPTGEARITSGFKLPASHVIHTVGPIYHDDSNPASSLKNAYRNSLAVAKDGNIKYIAFPAISCGVYGYPYEEAAAVAISTIKEFADDFKEVHFVLFSDDIFNILLKKAKELLLP